MTLFLFQGPEEADQPRVRAPPHLLRPQCVRLRAPQLRVLHGGGAEVPVLAGGVRRVPGRA